MHISQKTIDLLNDAFYRYHEPNFIDDDPIQIPHLFSKKQDIEIMGLLAATLAWGQRKTIINNCFKLVELFENNPYDFIINHSDEDLKPFLNFKHRTFNATDLLYFIAFLKQHYQKHESLETAFTINFSAKEKTVENALIHFHNYFTSLDFFPARTRKHIATPARKSACKRLNMYLRWMVREDDKGIDFGLWKNIKPSQLLCPLDIHVERQAKKLGLVKRKPTDFKAVLELTENLKKIDKTDPVKYDFALFGLGIEEKTIKG
ncbi:MAG: TIGR02757 family protein [Chitinophagales bacterium]